MTERPSYLYSYLDTIDEHTLWFLIRSDCFRNYCMAGKISLSLCDIKNRLLFAQNTGEKSDAISFLATKTNRRTVERTDGRIYTNITHFNLVDGQSQVNRNHIRRGTPRQMWSLDVLYLLERDGFGYKMCVTSCICVSNQRKQIHNWMASKGCSCILIKLCLSYRFY